METPPPSRLRLGPVLWVVLKIALLLFAALTLSAAASKFIYIDF